MQIFKKESVIILHRNSNQMDHAHITVSSVCDGKHYSVQANQMASFKI